MELSGPSLAPVIEVWTLALRASQREQLTKAGALELTAKARPVRMRGGLVSPSLKIRYPW